MMMIAFVMRMRMLMNARMMLHDAPTRFDAAETEYIAAKLDMQKKEDLKERMTEHLMIIIQENETRKAEKLQELMTKMVRGLSTCFLQCRSVTLDASSRQDPGGSENRSQSTPLVATVCKHLNQCCAVPCRALWHSLVTWLSFVVALC